MSSDAIAGLPSSSSETLICKLTTKHTWSSRYGYFSISDLTFQPSGVWSSAYATVIYDTAESDTSYTTVFTATTYGTVERGNSLLLMKGLCNGIWRKWDLMLSSDGTTLSWENDETSSGTADNHGSSGSASWVYDIVIVGYF